MTQPFYDGKKAAEAELRRRVANKEITEEEAKNLKIKAKIVYTYETTDD